MRDTLRERLHQLVDQLPPTEAPAAERYLEFLKDRAEHPVLRAVRNAPVDDEELTEDELEQISEGEDDIAKGNVVSLEELKRELEL
jgi:uncharacterized protein YecE (DUF72 family)